MNERSYHGATFHLFLTPNSRSVFCAGVSLNIHSLNSNIREPKSASEWCLGGGGGDGICVGPTSY